MKKQYFFIAILLTLQFSTFRSTAQVYEKGNLVIDAFYGFPNLFTGLVKVAASGYPELKVSSVGPLGFTAEYLIGERFGVGIEGTYSSTRMKGTRAGYTSEVQFNRYRILPRVNFHFGSNDKLDPYLTAGAGYASYDIKEKTNDPEFETLDVKIGSGLATRIGFGVRYFFTDNIGIMVEAGIGGAAVRGGLAVKF